MTGEAIFFAIVLVYLVALLVLLEVKMPKSGKGHDHEKKSPFDEIESALWAGVEKLERIAKALESAIRPQGARPTIAVTAVEDQPPKKENVQMTDHMPPLQLPVTTVRAQLSIINPRQADGTAVTSVSWATSDAAQLPLEAIPDSRIPDPAWVDPGDGSTAPMVNVFQTFANTPLTGDQVAALPDKVAKGTVTASAAGMADVDIEIRYSDPALGHMAITAVQAAEA